MNSFDRMHSGDIYDPNEPELLAEQLRALELLYDYNATRPSESDARNTLLIAMLASVGEGCCFEPPLHANWGGRHVHVGDHVYANFNLTLVDDGEIFIGDRVLFGPNVTVTTVGHPILPELRAGGSQFTQTVRIGTNVWVGAGAIIMPGVSIGDDSVIGGGSVVTRDVPSGVVAFGNPCRVIRPIGSRDREYYWRDRRYQPDPHASM